MTDLDQRLRASREVLPAGRDPLGPEEIRRRVQRRVARKRAVLACAMVAVIGVATFGAVRFIDVSSPLKVATDGGKGSDSSTPSTPPTRPPNSVPDSVPTTEVATTTTDSPTDPMMPGYSQFITPSGNIRCALQSSDGTPASAEVWCAIDSYDFPDPPRPASCPDWMDWAGGSFRFSSTEDPGPFCGTDTLLNPDRPMPTVGYGESVTLGDLRCDVATDGVTCRDTKTDKGFKLSKSAVKYF